MTDQHPAAIAADGHLDRDQWQRAITENLAALRGLLEHASAELPPEIPDPDGGDDAGWRRAVDMTLASCNELIPELTAAAGADPEFTAMVCDVFRTCSWALGFGWRGEPVPPGWVAPWAADPAGPAGT